MLLFDLSNPTLKLDLDTCYGRADCWSIGRIGSLAVVAGFLSSTASIMYILIDLISMKPRHRLEVDKLVTNPTVHIKLIEVK